MLTIDNIQQIVGVDFGMERVRLWRVSERTFGDLSPEYVIDINEGIYVHRIIIERKPDERGNYPIYRGYRRKPTIHYITKKQLQDKDEFLRVVRGIMLE